MRTKLLRSFTNNPYKSLHNVHKYLMMFLTVASYLAHHQRNLQALRERVIMTPDGKVSETNIHMNHQQLYYELI